MNRKYRLLALFLLACITALTVNCTEKQNIDDKLASKFGGSYKGFASFTSNPSSSKDLSLTITSEDNPIVGTYNLAGTAGNVSGSILGTILNLTLKPTTTGVTYTFSGNANDDNTAITGTMTGVESGTAVKYSVDLKK